MKQLIVILIVCLSTVCYAEESFLDRHEISIGYAPFAKHFNADDKDYNETVNAIFLSMDQWFIGTFKNSHYDQTVAGGYNFRTPKWKPLKNNFFLRANLYLGLMYGYDDNLANVGGISFAVAPTIEIGYKNISLDTMAIPVDGGVISTMIKWTF